MNELLAGIRQRLEGDRVLWGIALVLTVASLVSVLLFTFMFRVAEGPISQDSAGKSYSNMFWMTIITVTTVGYGDYYPQTPIGRIISVIVVSWGVLIVSVMVVVLTNAFAMDRSKP